MLAQCFCDNELYEIEDRSKLRRRVAAAIQLTSSVRPTKIKMVPRTNIS